MLDDNDSQSWPLKTAAMQTLFRFFMRHYALWLLVLVLAAQSAQGQDGQHQPMLVNQPAEGLFLVASETMPDPRFMQTVILLLVHDSEGTLGLIVNRPLDMTLADAAPQLAIRDHRQPVFLGGPVAFDKLLLLTRQSLSAQGLVELNQELFWGGSQAQFERLLNAGQTTDTLRIFAGHAGWSPGQLAAELKQKSWLLFKADQALVFTEPSELDSLWAFFMAVPKRILVQWIDAAEQHLIFP